MALPDAIRPLRSLQDSWRLLCRTPLSVLVGGVLVGLIGGSAADGPVLGLFLQGTPLALPEGSSGLERSLVVLGFAVCGAFALFLLRSWLVIGYTRAIANGFETGRDELARVFTGGDRLVVMLLARLLVGLGVIGSILPFAGGCLLAGMLFDAHGLTQELAFGFAGFSVLWFWFALYVGLGLLFVDPIVSLENLGPVASVARSWKLARGRRAGLARFVLAQTLLDFAGLSCCLVGQLLTTPLVETMRVELYLALARGEERSKWWIVTRVASDSETRSE